MPEEEISKQYRTGFDERLLKHRKLSREEEATLARRVRNGDRQAADELLRYNLRFIAGIAYRYLSRTRHFEFNDLMMIGIAAFIHNLPKYNPDTGNRLSMYMGWWVRHTLTRGTEDLDRMIQIPVHAWDKIRRFTQRQVLVADSTESAAEPSDSPNLPSKLSPEQEEGLHLLQAVTNTRVTSLDAPIHGQTRDMPRTLADLLDPADLAGQALTQPSAADLTEANERVLGVAAEVNQLPPHLRTLLHCRFWQELTFEKTAAELARRNLVGAPQKNGQCKTVSRERIRQIEQQAIDQLRIRLRRRFHED